MTLTKFLRTGTDGGSWIHKLGEFSGFVQAQIVDMQETILDEYEEKALALATYRKSPEGKTYGEIRKCRGVWAIAKTHNRCEKELKKVLSEWIQLKLKDADRDIPVIANIDINFLSLSVVSSETNS